MKTSKEMGVKIETNIIIGKKLSRLTSLFDMGYEAVFIGSGAGLPNFMGIPGESYNGVYSANEFLTRSNLMKAYESDPVTPIMKGGKVAVVGGGNVAMDAARSALRLGAEKVYIVYRRSMEELPARKEEVEHAIEEGIEFKLLNNPVEILGYHNPDDRRDPKNGCVTGVKCIKMELGEPDENGRRRPVPIEGSEFVLDVDTVIISIGTSPIRLSKPQRKVLKLTDAEELSSRKNGATTKEGVYAGGDAVTGAATVISAMGAGKIAAKAIDEYIQSK
ncbi:MAG: FAD-dependent oxidoreductase [Clostridiales bacterium]|nr:MAG: FAD-dependent oxidoreductase [Clostridiales bacterium]